MKTIDRTQGIKRGITRVTFPNSKNNDSAPSGSGESGRSQSPPMITNDPEYLMVTKRLKEIESESRLLRLAIDEYESVNFPKAKTHRKEIA